MESFPATSKVNGEPQFLFAGGDGQLVLSAADAQQLLAQAGIQVSDTDQIIIGGVPEGVQAEGATEYITQEQAEQLQLQQRQQQTVEVAAQEQQQQQPEQPQELHVQEQVQIQEQPQELTQEQLQQIAISQANDLHAIAAQEGIQVQGENGDLATAVGEINDGTILYIDPNDPQAAALLEQAGLTLGEDGNIRNLDGSIVSETASAEGQQVDTVQQEAGEGGQQIIEDGGGGGGQPVVLPDMPVAVATEEGTDNITEQTDDSQTIEQIQAAQQEALLKQQQEEQQQAEAEAEQKRLLQQQLEQQRIAAEQEQKRLEQEEQQRRHQLLLQQQEQRLRQQQQQQQLQQQRQQQQQRQKEAEKDKVIHVGPDQQQVLYSVTGEDGKTQQYMMLCPKDMDQQQLIQTLVKQITADPNNKGRKTIKITQQKSASKQIKGKIVKKEMLTVPKTPRTYQRLQGKPGEATPASPQPTTSTTSTPQPNRIRQTTPTKTPQQQQVISSQNEDIFSPVPSTSASTAASAANNVLTDFPTNQTVPLESVGSVAQDMLQASKDSNTRVYIKCNYCQTFRSLLTVETYDEILSHILPVSKEELHTSFYGDLTKHFIRSIRIQVNGKQIVKSGDMTIPQCEVILTHALVCRRTKKDPREFVVNGGMSLQLVADLAKHIRNVVPGNQSRDSLLCVFCNSPYTYEDYLRHLSPHQEAIVATLNCFAGAYCSNSYEETMKMKNMCPSCQEPEIADLRFLPCTKFSTEYQCTKKLQFAIDCFRENFGDNGYMRINNNAITKCSVCKSSQNVYCAVFHISTTIVMDNEMQDIESQFCVCQNCQKQFINIVMKEQGFEEKLKVFQLKNMEQLSSCLRVILNHAAAVCKHKNALIYSVQESLQPNNSATHRLRPAIVKEVTPITRLEPMFEASHLRTEARFVCDMCFFTVDLTSLVTCPEATQRNDMLIGIVLEHLVPHADSLMNVIASTAANQNFNLKFEILGRVSEKSESSGAQNRTIVLSLQRKFKSQTSLLEIPLDKNEEKTLAQIRSGVKAERKSHVTVRTVKGAETGPNQVIEINKFIEKLRGKFDILSKSGCNTSLLNLYADCRLCGKYSFPDFRLSGISGLMLDINLCETCVETVLSLCLPTDPEQLEVAEPCLVLGEQKLVGHRLVLSNDQKKWLSLDGVNLIKNTLDEYDDLKSIDCSNVFLTALKKHLVATLKKCYNDTEVISAIAGFCITDSFLSGQRTTHKVDDETSAALSALVEDTIGIPVHQQQAAAAANAEDEVVVKVVAKKPPLSQTRQPFIIRSVQLKNGVQSNNKQQVVKRIVQQSPIGAATQRNGKVIDLTGGSPRKVEVVNTIDLGVSGNGAQSGDVTEESVSAIQNFLNETTPAEGGSAAAARDMKVPAGIKITNAGKGVVNIRAIADQRPSPASSARVPLTVSPVKSSPQVRTGTGGTPSVSMVTLTSGGIIRRIQESKRGGKFGGRFTTLEDEGDDEDELDYEPAPPSKRLKYGDDADFVPRKSVVLNTPSPAIAAGSGGSSDEAPGGSGRSKRQRKEKKIFDL